MMNDEKHHVSSFIIYNISSFIIHHLQYV